MNNANMNAHQNLTVIALGRSIGTPCRRWGISSYEYERAGYERRPKSGRHEESLSKSQAFSEATQRTEEAKQSFSQQSQNMMTDTFRSATQYAQDQGFVTDGSVDWSRMSQDQQGQQYMSELSATRQGSRPDYRKGKLMMLLRMRPERPQSKLG
ncbi:hypothetical protein HSBAA_PA_4060 (plasmid) [Vreelandella sulfidaeris]|uniref:Uncharacterized protein n=1 Tax=Vreelandella sulfidaeris TaxID=115553 RepID=A0A455UKD3_9GAMM|nr:hypothetical protein HSBAA_PA_4060 [Halomonas sulfidaeris]